MSATTDPSTGSDTQVSQARIRANRRNARKSTGPRTEAGKARSSVNAVTHGLCSDSVTLFPGETPEAYWHFRHAMVDALDPRDLAQLSLAERAASCAWRLRRVDGAEATLVRTQPARGLVRAVLADVSPGSPVGRAAAELQAALAAQEDAAWAGRDGASHRANLVNARQQFDRQLSGQIVDPGEALAMTLVAPGDGPALERLGRYEQRLQNQLHRALRELRVLQQQAKEREAETGGRCPYVPASFYDASEDEAGPAAPSTPVNRTPDVQNEPNAPSPAASDGAAGGCDAPSQEGEARPSGTGVPPVLVESQDRTGIARDAAGEGSKT